MRSDIMKISSLLKATLNKSVRVELVETYLLKINNLQMASTGSARTDGLVQHCLNPSDATIVLRGRKHNVALSLRFNGDRAT
jgi:hypothetical protein